MQCAYCYNAFDETKYDICPKCGKSKKYQEIALKFDDKFHVKNGEKIFHALKETFVEICREMLDYWNTRKIKIIYPTKTGEYFQAALDQIQSSTSCSELYTVIHKIGKDKKCQRVMRTRAQEENKFLYFDTMGLVKDFAWVEAESDIIKLEIEKPNIKATIQDAGGTYWTHYLFYISQFYENSVKQGLYLVRTSNQASGRWYWRIYKYTNPDKN